jgi:hypothetical protein
MASDINAETLRGRGIIIYGECGCAKWSDKHLGQKCPVCSNRIKERTSVARIEIFQAQIINLVASVIHQSAVARGQWDDAAAHPSFSETAHANEADFYADEIISIFDHCQHRKIDIGEAIMRRHHGNLVKPTKE